MASVVRRQADAAAASVQAAVAAEEGRRRRPRRAAMIVHIVLFQPREDLTEETSAQVLDDLRHAAATIPIVRRFRIGRRDEARPAGLRAGDARGLQLRGVHRVRRCRRTEHIPAAPVAPGDRRALYDLGRSVRWRTTIEIIEEFEATVEACARAGRLDEAQPFRVPSWLLRHRREEELLDDRRAAAGSTRRR